MAPVLLQVGPISIYGYGLMLFMAFVAAFVILTLELRRKLLDLHLARHITLLAIVFGVAGSKALSLFDQGELASLPSWLGAWRDTMTWYGGLLGALAAILVYLRLRAAPTLKVLDAGAPALMLAYGIGRLGCHLAGDGDYGLPTHLPWAARYDHGLVPPSQAFAGLPELVDRFPGGVVPDDIPCHPTPVYEFGLAVFAGAALLAAGRRQWPDGSVFWLYLVLASAQRFAIEFLRLNPPIALGLTEAQLIALSLGFIGLGGLARRHLRSLSARPVVAGAMRAREDGANA